MTLGFVPWSSPTTRAKMLKPLYKGFASEKLKSSEAIKKLHFILFLCSF